MSMKMTIIMRLNSYLFIHWILGFKITIITIIITIIIIIIIIGHDEDYNHWPRAWVWLMNISKKIFWLAKGGHFKNGASHSDFLFVNIEPYKSKKCVT